MYRFSLDQFVDGYAQAILFTETDDSSESGGDPLDDAYGIEDFAEEAFAALTTDCQQFAVLHQDLLLEAMQRPGYTSAQAGHDFWLTREGHGAGFWDRPELRDEGLGNRLKAAAEAYGQHHEGIMLENDQVWYGSAKRLAIAAPLAAPLAAPAVRRSRRP